LPEPGAPFEPGERVDQFEVVRLIGRGGMGRVYEAKGPEGQPVALKVLEAGIDGALDPNAVERFRREGATLAKIAHPAIVGLVGQGEADGTAFLALELVRGRDLEEILGEVGRLSLPETLWAARACAEALAAAHEAGVTHRDVKPGNLMVAGDGTVKLTDFGVSLADDDAAVRLTHRDETVGTVDYLGPEILQGEDWTPAGDVYGLGVLVFRLLAGAPPFAGGDPATLIMAVLSQQPPPLSARAPDAPPPLVELAGRLLEKDPTLRPTARETAQALAAVPGHPERAVVAREWGAGRFGEGYFSA